MPERAVAMKINFGLLIILILAGSLLSVENKTRGVQKKSRHKYSKMSPEFRADAIKTLREIYGAILRLDQKLAQFEESIMTLDRHKTKDRKAC